jgi:type I restriction-modification system DNA methylase subunit
MTKATLVKAIKTLGHGKYRPHQVFCDWAEATAIAISNTVDITHREAREARYDKAEMTEFANMFATLAPLMETESGDTKFGDLMGEVFMLCEFGNDATGQFFTPYEVALLMAQMQIDGAEQAIAERGHVRMSEPAVGAGAMCIAMAQAMHERGINYQERLHVQANDIDATCLHMAYIQMSVLGIPAKLILGNSLLNEVREVWHTPMHFIKDWDFRLIALLPQTELALAEQAEALIHQSTAATGSQFVLF